MHHLTKSALIEDLSDNQFLQRYSFTREDETKGSVELRPAEANRWKSFLDHLQNRNAHRSLLNQPTIEAAAASEPKSRLAYAEATGWRPGQKTFVLPDRVVGTNSKRICGLRIEQNTRRSRPKGDAENWLKTVAHSAKKSSSMMFTLSCAFAAPLLKFANEDSFGFCLAGKTGGGKTTAALAASSVFATGLADELLSWNATLAGLEPFLRSHNDCLMIVDDLNKMPVASEREKYQSAKNFAHNLGTGAAKLRSVQFDESANNGGHYRVISLTSAESTIAELAGECGQQRGGDARRLIDVPVYFDGLGHIFDRVPNAAELVQSDLATLYSNVRVQCAAQHGQIFFKYLRFLIRSRAKLPKKIQTHSKRFLKEFAADPGIVNADITRKFGLIYAGGAIAIEGVALPWRRADLLQAVVRCCRVALDTLNLEQISLKEGWGLLKARLMELPQRSTISANGWNTVDGFVEQQPDRYRCIIRADKFNRTFANSLQAKLVMKELKRREWVTRSRSQQNQEQFVWPDGTRRRSLEIHWGRKPSAS